MKHLTKNLRVPGALACLLAFSLSANAGNLYSWNSADGTPTYSPDPPPPGTVYTIVGPDLEPIERYRKPAQPAAEAPATATANAQPAKPKWKPVVFTDAPATGGQPAPVRKSKKDELTSQAKAGVADLTECMKIRRLITGLENSFARANSNAEMDQAVMALQEQTDLYQAQCRNAK